MKFLFTIGLSMIAFLFGMGQSLDEVKQELYHDRLNSAQQKLEALLTSNPENAEAWYLITQVYLQTDSVEKAKEKLMSAPAGTMSNPLVQCALGHIYLRLNQPEAAKPYFSNALEKTRSKDPNILHAVAKAHLDASAGDPGYGVELINQALKKDKKNPALYVTLGDLYRKLSDGSASYKAYQQALNYDEKYVIALYKIGKIFTSQDNKEMYLNYFNKAVAIDPLYAPALYELYYHYYFRDVNIAKEYLDKYIAASDKSIKNDYLVTDLLFASKKYPEAIENARSLVDIAGENQEPRLLKLIAYSFKEMNNTDSAFNYMKKYFSMQQDTGFVVKDFETMGDIYDSLPGMADSASSYYQKALAMESDTTKALAYYKKIADLYKENKDFTNEAIWLGKYYQANPSPTNIDLFNWGIASYKAKNYMAADSAFKIYEEKYPDQSFGYYWAARSNTVIDSTMENGLAIPHYQKVIEIAQKDTTDQTNRKYLIEAYGYVAAYEANVEKDYDDSIEYFEKLLELDPNNSDARKYVEILKKNLAKQDGVKEGK